MILPEYVEERLLRIESEFSAQERLSKYHLMPKKKILLFGSPGCGKTLTAERLAWNLGLPLLKVRFD
jgi:SpoVK/Ycf46/Vps4 family AAA+-type ATPase